MPRIVIEPTRPGVTARVFLVEISDIDSIYGLACTGDGLDECPGAGFEPGDTWGDGSEDAIEAAKIHVAAHERRRCEECGQPNSAPLVVKVPLGVVEERYACTSCGHVEVLS